MIKTYEIKYEPIVINGEKIEKENVYYYHDDVLQWKDIYTRNGIVQQEINTEYKPINPKP